MVIEALKQLVDRRFQLCLDDLDDALRGDGLDGVLQARQRMDVVRWQQVGPRAQQLSQLDEAWPELFEGAGELSAVVVLVVFGVKTVG